MTVGAIVVVWSEGGRYSFVVGASEESGGRIVVKVEVFAVGSVVGVIERAVVKVIGEAVVEMFGAEVVVKLVNKAVGSVVITAGAGVKVRSGKRGGI